MPSSGSLSATGPRPSRWRRNDPGQAARALPPGASGRAGGGAGAARGRGMSLEACAERVRRGDPDRFLATLAAPPAGRARLWPLYAFNLELARAAWVSAEPAIGEMRLQWWREAVAAAAGGETRAHEVAAPLAGLIRTAGLPVALLDAMAVARRREVWREGFADPDALAAHLEATAGTLMWLAALALGAPAAAEPAVRDFAFGAGLAAWLRAVPTLSARGVPALPDDRPEAVAALARAGLARIARARAARRTVPAAATPALLAGWQAPGLLALAAAQPARVAEGRLALPEIRRRGILALRAATGRW